MGVVSFKTDETAQNAIETLAKAQGVSPGSFCRSLVLAEIGVAMPTARVTKQVADRDILRSLLGELGRHGSLLNQVARRANIGAAASELASDLAVMRDAYVQAVQAIASALGVERNP